MVFMKSDVLKAESLFAVATQLKSLTYWFSRRCVLLLLAAALLVAGCGGADSGISSISSVGHSSFNNSSSAQSSSGISSSDQVFSSSIDDGISSSSSSSSTGSLAANRPPVVAITSPSADQVLPFGQPVNVEATASDSDGRVEGVLLLLNDTLVARDDTAPYSWPGSVLPSLNRLSVGEHTLKVIATDNLEATDTQTLSFRVEVGIAPPTVSFVTPADLLILPPLSSITVEASTTGAAPIVGVSLFINDVLVAEDNLAPYAWASTEFADLSEFAVGDYIFKLRVVDGNGNSAEVSRTVRISLSADLEAGDKALGAKQYVAYCMGCHGQFGQGSSRGKALLENNGGAFAVIKAEGLAAKIATDMPPAEPAQCVDQCARNIANYLRDVMPELAMQHAATQADLTMGSVEYARQCASCHGDDARGAERGGPLLPLRGDASYTLRTIDYTSEVGLFTKIDLGMPLGRFSFADATATHCVGQCAKDVEAYLRSLNAALTPEELLQLQLIRGEQDYLVYCSRCHGEAGTFGGSFGITSIIPLDLIFQSPTTLDDNDLLFIKNRDTMPPRSPEACIGRCAEDVTVYIREVLD